MPLAGELFFKWIKQHLRIKAVFGTNENAVKTQIWITSAFTYTSTSKNVSASQHRLHNPTYSQPHAFSRKRRLINA